MKPGSKSWKKLMAKLYGWGASIVILGALFKIEHWPGASQMLILGLGTEAVIFFFSAFEPLPKDDPDFAKIKEDLGDLSSAFENYVAGGELRQKLLAYEFAQDQLLFGKIKAH